MNKFGLTVITSTIQFLITGITFIFGMLMAYYFGASGQMDAYVVSANLISLVYALFVFSQTRVLIPYLGSINDSNEQKKVASSITRFNLYIFIFIAALFFLFAPQIIFLLAPGLSKGQHVLGGTLLRISTGYFFLSNFTAIGKGIIEFHLQPILSVSIRLIQVVFLVCTLLLLHNYLSIYALPVSHVISVLITLPIYFLYAIKKRYPLRSRLPLWNIHIKKYLVLISPIILSQILMRIIKLTDSYLASFLDEGSLSYVSYSLRIVANFDHLFAGVYIVYFPLLAKLSFSEHDIQHLKTFMSGFQTIFLVALSFTVFLVLFAPEIIQVIFERGDFCRKDTIAVANLIRGYALMVLCAPLGSYFANAFYSRQDSKRATVYSAISSVTNIVLNFIFIKIWGILGLAISSSIAYLIGNILHAANLNKINKEFKVKLLLKEIGNTVFVVSLSILIPIIIKYNVNTSSQGVQMQIIFILVNLAIYSGFVLFITYHLNYEISVIGVKKLFRRS